MTHTDSVFKILNPNKNTHLVILKINNNKKDTNENENLSDDLTDFLDKMPDSDKKDYKNLHHQIKKQEFLAGRLALQKALTFLEYEYKGIKKDENGKPYLIDYEEDNQENIHISLTHSYPFVGALVSRHANPFGACGIDIEQVKEKILRVAPRVFSENEIAFLEENLQKNTVFWCAKEVLYKIYGKGEVNFRENLFIFPFENPTENKIGNETDFKVLAEIKMPDFNQKYTFNIAFLEDFVLCYGGYNA